MKHLIDNKTAINVLHVTHPWEGGIKAYIEDLTKSFEDGFSSFVLKSSGDRLEIESDANDMQKKPVYYLSKKLELSDFYNPEYANAISLILKAYQIDLVHISSGIYHTFDIFKISRQEGIPVVFTVHDFFYICPSIHLVEKDGNFCGICRHGQERASCLNSHPYVYSRFNAQQLQCWRDEFFRVKNCIDFFVFPSNSAKDIFSKFYRLSESQCRVIPHGLAINGTVLKKQERRIPGLRVGILGSMLKHKGRHILTKTVNTIDDEEIVFIHFGDGKLKGRNLKRYGRYQRAEIIHLLRMYQIDVVLLLSTWPETFSYTLSEAIAAHIPVIVTKFGALKERVEHQGIGWVVDHNKPESICALLLSLKKDKDRIEECAQRMAMLKTQTLEQMKNEYRVIYGSALMKMQTSGSAKNNHTYYHQELENRFGGAPDNSINIWTRIHNFVQKVIRSISFLIY